MASLGRYERSTNIWPGFVDALATLLMVIIFLLLIFVLAQFFLGQALSGRDSALQRLEIQVSELADLLSLEQRANKNLTENLAQLSEQLQLSVAGRDDLNATVSVLRATVSENQAEMDKMFSQILSDKRELHSQNLEIASLGQDVDALRALRAELEKQVSNLATRADILRDAINKEKETPLHLLLKSENQITNSATVRELIFRGADRKFLNMDGKTPYDLVEDFIDNEKMRKDLQKMLGPQPTYYPCFHIKQPMKK